VLPRGLDSAIASSIARTKTPSIAGHEKTPPIRLVEEFSPGADKARRDAGRGAPCITPNKPAMSMSRGVLVEQGAARQPTICSSGR